MTTPQKGGKPDEGSAPREEAPLARDREDSLRRLLDGLEDGYYATDLAGNLTDVNEAACRIFRRSRQDLLGMNNRAFMPPEIAKEVYRLFNEVYRTGRPKRTTNWQILRPDGSARDIEASISLRRSPEGEAAGFRGLFRDVTERRAVERALKAAEERYRLLFELSPVGIFRTSSSDSVLDANPAARAMFGVGESEESLSLLSVEKLYTDPSQRNEVVEELLRTGLVTNRVVTLRRADGGTFTALLNAIVEEKPVRGGERFFYGTIVDFSERMKMQDALERSGRQYRLLFEASLAGVYTMDLQGRLLGCNRAFSAMFGFESPEEAVQVSYGEDHAFTEEDEDHRLFMETLKKKGVQVNRETLVRRKSGEPFWILENASLVEEPGREPYILGSALDLTNVKTAESLRLREQKLEATALLTQGLAHELRNPLFAIELNVANIAKKEGLAPAGAESLAHIRQHLGRLSRLMDKVSDLGQSLSGEELRVVNPATAAVEAVALLRESLPQWTGEVTVGEAQEGVRLRGVRRALVRALALLMENAAEASSPGSAVAVDFENRGDGLAIRVRDGGTGIEKEALPRIFDPFFTTKAGHPGLGLALCRHLVEAQGGTLTGANNDPPPGAVFTLTMPLVQGE